MKLTKIPGIQKFNKNFLKNKNLQNLIQKITSYLN